MRGKRGIGASSRRAARVPIISCRYRPSGAASSRWAVSLEDAGDSQTRSEVKDEYNERAWAVCCRGCQLQPLLGLGWVRPEWKTSYSAVTLERVSDGLRRDATGRVCEGQINTPTGGSFWGSGMSSPDCEGTRRDTTWTREGVRLRIRGSNSGSPCLMRPVLVEADRPCHLPSA